MVEEGSERLHQSLRVRVRGTERHHRWPIGYDFTLAHTENEPSGKKLEIVDPDPTLSRELETIVQRFIDTKLDKNLYEVQSVTCRGSSCQILSVGDTERGGPTWSQVFAPILRDVSKASPLNPSTGAELEPTMQSIFTVPKSGSIRGFVTLIWFN